MLAHFVRFASPHTHTRQTGVPASPLCFIYLICVLKLFSKLCSLCQKQIQNRVPSTWLCGAVRGGETVAVENSGQWWRCCISFGKVAQGAQGFVRG